MEALLISGQRLAPFYLSIELVDIIQRTIHVTRSTINYRLERWQWYTLSVHTDLSPTKLPESDFRFTVNFRIDNRVVFNSAGVMMWVCPPKMELRPAVSKIEAKDPVCDFILLNSVLEEGGVIETGQGRECHAKDPTRYE